MLFRAIGRLTEAREPVDAITVCEFLRAHDALGRSGGTKYIGELVTNTLSQVNVHRYAQIVRETAMRRELIAIAQAILERAQTPAGITMSELVHQAEAEMLSVRAREHSNVTWLSDALNGVVCQLEKCRQGGGTIPGLPSGFTDLDQLTAGFEPGDLVILAARPSMGKTALAMNIAEHVAVGGGTVAVFSLEMAQAQLARRLLSAHSRVPMKIIRVGALADTQWRSIREAQNKLSPLPIALDDTSAASCAHVAARCRRIKRERGLALVVVDYLQLMRGTGETREQEVASISRGLKALAKDLAVPVLCLAQLNRKVDDRADKRPMLSDLRESGAVEQDADIVLMLYRDELYNPGSEARGTAEVLIRKHRNGPTGDVRLTFIGELMHFGNYAGGSIRSSPKPRGFHADG